MRRRAGSGSSRSVYNPLVTALYSENKIKLLIMAHRAI